MERIKKKNITAGEIAAKVEEIAPKDLQEEWDNSGFQVGSEQQIVTSVLTCLDLSFAVLEEAKAKGCEMILTHHPLLFHGIKSLTDADMTGALIRQLVKDDITVYSCHTPFDKVKGGNNDLLAEILELTNVRNLAGARVQSAEKMAAKHDEADIGRSGQFPRPVSIMQLIERLCDGLKIRPQSIRVAMPSDKGCPTNLEDKLFSRAGLCTGAGADLLPMASKLGCDVFVTGDVRYHEAQEALACGICLIDAGHYGTEKTFAANMQKLLEPKIEGRAKVMACEQESDLLQPCLW